MSNAVKRRFPEPSYRAADYPGLRAMDVRVRIGADGVEAESGACGTGAVATAVAGVEAHGMSLPMHVRSSQGYDLVIEGDYRQSQGTGFTLTGPVRTVFEGEIDLDLLETEE